MSRGLGRGGRVQMKEVQDTANDPLLSHCATAKALKAFFPHTILGTWEGQQIIAPWGTAGRKGIHIHITTAARLTVSVL